MPNSNHVKIIYHANCGIEGDEIAHLNIIPERKNESTSKCHSESYLSKNYGRLAKLLVNQRGYTKKILAGNTYSEYG